MEHTQASSAPDLPPSGGILDRALGMVEFLRARCPWDAAQTPESLQRHLLEEAHEVADAIARADDRGLADELGDLLLNLAFQVVLGEERSAFTRDQVVRGLEQKMQRRHPHLFGLGDAEPWDRIKERERRERARPGEPEAGWLDRVPLGTDPLLHAHRIQQRAAEVGFDWPDARGAWEKVREETEEVGRELDPRDQEALEEELGDLLFSVVNLARLAGAHAPTAMVRANAKFARRFAAMERLAHARGLVLGEASLPELDILWEEAKRAE